MLDVRLDVEQVGTSRHSFKLINRRAWPVCRRSRSGSRSTL